MAVEAGALGAALALTLVLVLGAIWVWYHGTGWQPFTVGLGETATWTPAGGRPVSKLRFRKVKFAVTNPAGTPGAADVTGNLNAMARGLADAKSPPQALGLAKPLNGFSFPLPNFNDPVSGEGSGWCPAGGACPAAPRAASLAGEFRTV